MDDWPSHSSELSRKVLTTLEKMVQDNMHFGKPTEDEIHQATGYLYDTVAGLVPAEVSDILLQVYGAKR